MIFTKLPIDLIRLDGGTQFRSGIRQDWIDEYAAMMRGGIEFDPIIVFFDGENRWLADGYHRVGAAKQCGFTEIEADVKEGDQRAAILYAVGANEKTHHKRTREEARRAVLTMLADNEWRQWSNNRIAKACNVSGGMVGDWRAADTLHLQSDERTYIDKYGNVIKMNVSAIGRRPSAEPEAPVGGDELAAFTDDQVREELQRRGLAVSAAGFSDGIEGAMPTDIAVPADAEQDGEIDDIDEADDAEIGFGEPAGNSEVITATGDDEILKAARRIKARNAAARKAAYEREITERAKNLPPAGERHEIIHGSLEVLLDRPAESVDFVITDPPYPDEYLPLFGKLGEVAAHLLKPGGLLLCMSGQTYLPDVYAMLGQHLDYHWTTAYLTPGGQATQIFPRRVNTFWKPIIIYSKGEYTGDWFGDVTRSDVNDNDKRHHHWGQSESGMLDLMQRFIRPGHVVVDPFLGGGTTAIVALQLGAYFLGTDVDPKAIATSKVRLYKTAVEELELDGEGDAQKGKFSPIIKPTDCWSFNPPQYGRIGDTSGHGYIPGDVYANCLFRYTKPGDVVAAPMAGSGQIMRVYEARHEWAIPEPWDLDIRMSDLNSRGPYVDRIAYNDLTKELPVNRPDYIVMDVPYLYVVKEEYSDKSEDLANMSLDDWMEAMEKIAAVCAETQADGALCTVICSNYSNIIAKRYVATSQMAIEVFQSAGYVLHEMAYSPRHIQKDQNSYKMGRRNNSAKQNKISLTDMTIVTTFRRNAEIVGAVDVLQDEQLAAD